MDRGHLDSRNDTKSRSERSELGSLHRSSDRYKRNRIARRDRQTATVLPPVKRRYRAREATGNPRARVGRALFPESDCGGPYPSSQTWNIQSRTKRRLEIFLVVW